VVGKVLATLTSLCELGLFQKMRIWELMSATLGFLYHPNVWIRQGEDFLDEFSLCFD
jgi:phosphoinositide-3-kinase, regulatory subunit 4